MTSSASPRLLWTAPGCQEQRSGPARCTFSREQQPPQPSRLRWRRVLQTHSPTPWASRSSVPPASGTATCVIGGHSVNAVFSVDAHTTVTNLVATLNGTPAIAALVTAYAYNGPQSSFTWIVQIFAVAQGTSGNGITVATNGVGGASWYTGFPATGTTFGGQDVTLTISGVQFIANWDTDADTTVNNLITLITADAPTLALVTPTLVIHHCSSRQRQPARPATASPSTPTG